MSRTVSEWKGRTDDTPIPPRVKLRILARQGDRCRDCGQKFGGKLRPEFDHRPAMINGGENRESKIDAVCAPCHAICTKADVAEKSAVAKTRKSHLSIKARKGRPMAGTVASGWRKRFDGTAERR